MNKSHMGIPFIGSLTFSFRHLRQPWVFLPVMMNRATFVTLKSKDESIMLNGKQDFWKLRNLINHGWEIIDVKGKLIYVKKGNIVISGQLSQLGVLYEPLEESYRVFDYRNRTVLDVGGYIGYSSVLFSRWGARRVIVYEAQRENIETLRRNLKINGVDGEVHNLAIADRDGEIELSYEELGTTAFGLGGCKKYRVKSIEVSKVLSRPGIDIAKFDCEGCEYSLLSVPCEILRNVPRYVMEYHRGFKALKKKFEECGYRVELLWKIETGIGGLKAEVRQ